MARKTSKKGSASKRASGGASRARGAAKPAGLDGEAVRAGKAKGGATRTKPGKPAAKGQRGPAGRIAAEPVSAGPPADTARHLSPGDMEEFRLMLLEKRAQLLGDLGTLQDVALRGSRREASGDLSSMPVHMADLGTDNYELEFTLGLLEGERAVLHEIDEALERIRKGSYGTCLATGRPIGKARLRAKPWAKFCYEYTLDLEKGKQRRL